LNELVLALGASAFAGGLLLGIFVGFRVVTRDASLLAVLDRRVAQSLDASSAAKARADSLEAQWVEHLAALERKRAAARAERQRADEATARGSEVPPALPEPLPEPTPRERRRMLGRIGRQAPP
jgi:hypothetical protein